MADTNFIRTSELLECDDCFECHEHDDEYEDGHHVTCEIFRLGTLFGHASEWERMASTLWNIMSVQDWFNNNDAESIMDRILEAMDDRRKEIERSGETCEFDLPRSASYNGEDV